MKKFIRIGVDLAKNYFQVHALVSEGGPVVARKLRRSRMHEFFSRIEPCRIGMEACGSAHYWARERGLDLPRKSGEAFAQRDASFSNWVGLR